MLGMQYLNIIIKPIHSIFHHDRLGEERAGGEEGGREKELAKRVAEKKVHLFSFPSLSCRPCLSPQ